MVPHYSSPAAMARHEGAYAAAPHVQQPPRFTKLEFATYDGTVDPLNWLNQCDQFFRGQRTLASDRTWIASYHLCGAAQMWYYALEQDDGGMPPWERFRALFPPPVRPPDTREPAGRDRPPSLHLLGPGLRQPLPDVGMPCT
jgi:hypothetical protein